MTVIHATDVADKHEYLAKARPEWSRSMWGIRNQGGPWKCETCDGASLLSWRCSICGAELTSDADTHGRESTF